MAHVGVYKQERRRTKTQEFFSSFFTVFRPVMQGAAGFLAVLLVISGMMAGVRVFVPPAADDGIAATEPATPGATPNLYSPGSSGPTRPTYKNWGEDEGKLILNCEVSITTIQFEAALEMIQDLPGTVVWSNIVDNGNNRRSARIDMSVKSEDFDHVAAILAGMYGVDWIDETREALSGVEDMDYLAANLAAKENEYERLLALFGDAETLGDILIVQKRISTVIGEIESCKGLINYWDAAAKSGSVTIRLTEKPLDEGGITAEKEKFTAADSFMASLRATGYVGESILIGMAGAALPLLIIAGLTAIVLVIVVRRKKNEK